jgi:hypothetical protein
MASPPNSSSAALAGAAVDLHLPQAVLGMDETLAEE